MKQRFSSKIAPSRLAATIGRLGWLLLSAAVVFPAACSGETSTGEKKETAKEVAMNTLGTAEQIRLDEPRLSVRLPVATTGPAAERLRQALAEPAARFSAELVLDGITVSKPPGVMFNVYLSTAGPNSRRQYVGTLSFFGVDHRSGPVDLHSRTFDVTERLQALKGKDPQLPEIQVVFEATDGTANSTTEKVGSLLNRQAGLRVGSVRLQVQGKP
ncbi:MAG TPA: hypothetical protein VLV54_10670 [Thermoanaerobaculia bacterium]|nr:hypothetical protein [Thermoanaerobaculia bacterium]